MSESTERDPLVLRPDVVATVLDDGAVLLDLETKYFYLLNSTAWAITQLFETGTTVERARAQCRAYEPAEGDDGAGEVIGFLLRDGLVVPHEEDLAPSLELTGPWTPPTIEKQPEPLQRVMVSAFDPSVPLAE